MTPELNDVRYFLHCWKQMADKGDIIHSVNVESRPAHLTAADLERIVEDLSYWERLVPESLRQTVTVLIAKGTDPSPKRKAERPVRKLKAPGGPDTPKRKLKAPETATAKVKPLHAESASRPGTCEDCGEIWSPVHDCADPF